MLDQDPDDFALTRTFLRHDVHNNDLSTLGWVVSVDCEAVFISGSGTIDMSALRGGVSPLAARLRPLLAGQGWRTFCR
eukprot:jgi/Botrbrau1/12620/Bobra.0169s0147.1